jgi:hypothetical protein
MRSHMDMDILFKMRPESLPYEARAAECSLVSLIQQYKGNVGSATVKLYAVLWIVLLRIDRLGCIVISIQALKLCLQTAIPDIRLTV